jgi:hypothetical protein
MLSGSVTSSKPGVPVQLCSSLFLKLISWLANILQLMPLQQRKGCELSRTLLVVVTYRQMDGAL